MKMLTTKHLPRPSNMLLKDYLRDDLSSCSSSGFKSFPRRQCCSTVRFDIQAKRNPGLLIPPTTTKPPRSSSTLSALHKASQAVIKAVRLLPFPSNNKKTRLLSKTLSRKVLSRRFWRKAVKEEQKEKEIPSRRWRSFRDLLLEDADHKPPDQHAQSESSNIKSHHNSWGSSEEFTWSSTENDTVGSKENTIRNKTAVKAADEDPADAASTLQKAMDWGSEEKEQFSPVSVLECPFDDEDISSPEGSKHKVIMKKSRHFDGIANSVKPVELEERMASEAVVEEEEEVWRVVDEVIRSSSVPTSSKCLVMSKAEKKVLFDLFKEMRSDDEEYYNDEGQVYKVAEEWVSGEFSEQVVNLDGEMYIREMDKCGGWTNVSDQEWTRVGMDLEFQIFTTLLNDLLLEHS